MTACCSGINIHSQRQLSSYWAHCRAVPAHPSKKIFSLVKGAIYISVCCFK